MSALLEAVSLARELRADAEQEFRAALVRAKTAHSWAEIAKAAGLTAPGARYLVRRARGEIDGYSRRKEMSDED